VRLKVLLPTKVLIDEPVAKVIAEAENGSFCLEERHIDFVAALVPGLLSFRTPQNEEVFVAVDEGTLVKCGPEVLVSTRDAVRGPDLAELRDTVVRRFRELDEMERTARAALGRLEASVVRRFLQLGEESP
jgi:F-type H+-transporting ATPase subunit epsilon